VLRATGGPGTAAFINLLPGDDVLVEAFLDSSEERIASARVHIRPGTLTLLHLGPTPLP
jgi:hypothetical protein